MPSAPRRPRHEWGQGVVVVPAARVPGASKSRDGVRRALLADLVLCLALFALGCRDRPPPIEQKRQPLPESVGRPGSVFATFVLPRPARTWSVLRPELAAELPRDPRVALGLLLGTPPAVVESVDLSAPVRGALLRDADATRLVVAFPVRGASELLAKLSRGSNAPYRAEDRGEVVGLEPKSGAAGPLAIVGDFLLIAPSVAAAAVAGPYLVTSSMPPSSASTDLRMEFSGDEVATTVAAAVREQWRAQRRWLQNEARTSRMAHGGRAPDFGDPEIALSQIDEAVARLTEIARELEGAVLAFEAREGRLDVRLEPRWAKGAFALTSETCADERGWVPPHAGFALFVCGGIGRPAALATRAVLRVLGSRAKGPTEAALSDLAEALQATFDGPTSVVDVGSGDGGPRIAVRSNGSGAAPRVVDAIAKAARVESIRQPLSELLGGVPRVDVTTAGASKGEMKVWLGRSRPAATVPAEAVDVRLAWSVREDATLWLAGKGPLVDQLDGLPPVAPPGLPRAPGQLVAYLLLSLANEDAGNDGAVLVVRRHGASTPVTLSLRGRTLGGLVRALGAD